MSSPRLLLVAAALIAAMPTARASTLANQAGYLTSGNARSVTDSSGECWHTGEWRPRMRFGQCEPQAAASGQPKVAPAVAEVAKPASLPKPLPPIRLSADTLFPFDSVMLTAQGRAALDALESRIADADYRFVDVAGHADRLGTASYNRDLSERRAQAVRAYLAEHGLDAGRIRAKGFGSTQPVTSSAQCDGLPRAGLIRCLQPDRYAEVTLVATARTASAAR